MTMPAAKCADETAIPSDADKFLTSAQTRARYGNVSDMWLWRRLHDGSGFPQPMVLNKRRYWRLSDLIAWERARGSQSAALA